MTDIVERLRKREMLAEIGQDRPDIYRDAADEIERLREALDPFARMAGWLSSSNTDPDDLTPLWDANDLPTLGDLRAAKAALGESDE